MAAYRADIEIGVKGIQEIGILQKKLEGTIYKINELNSKSVKNFGGVAQSIQNYSKQLFLAEKALYRVAAGSTQEARAVSNYVSALGNANAVRSRQNKLIQEEIRLREEVDRKNRLASAGIKEVTQYAAPAMPGRADTIEQFRIEAAKRSGAERREALKLATREAETEARINEILSRRVAIQQRNKANREGASNAIIGGAFPLLFGQGVGASIGGGLGGFVGGRMGGQLGFGLSLVGTALGGLFDQATRSAADFSKSLRAGGDAAGYLEQQLGSIDPQVRDQIRNLQNSGQTARAAELAFNELANQIGVENAKAFRQLGDETNTFGSGFQRLVTTVIAGAARMDDELKPFFSRLGAISLAVPGVNAAALTRGAIDFVRGQGKQPSPQASKTPEAVQREQALRSEVSLLQQRLQLTTVSAQGDLQSFVNVSRRVAIQENAVELQRIENEYKKGALTLDEMRLQKTVANLKLQQNFGEIERQRIQEERRRSEEAARAAKQALEEQRRAYQNMISARNELNKAALDEYKILQQGVDFVSGDVAGYKQKSILIQKIYDVQREVLVNEWKAAQASEEYAANSVTIDDTFRVRLNNLQLELQYTKQVNTAVRDRAVLEQQLTQQQQRRALEQDLQGLRMPGNMDTMQQLLVEQAQRRQQLLGTRFDELDQLQTKLAAPTGVFNRTQIAEFQARLADVNNEIGMLTEGLAQVDAAEIAWERNRAGVQALQDAMNTIGTTITGIFSDLITGTNDWNNVLLNTFNTFANLFLQAGLGALAGSDGKGFFSFLTGSLKFRANGGPVSAGSPYVVGERGPELFVPGRSGTIVPNDKMGGNSVQVGSINISVENTGDTLSPQAQKQIAGQVRGIVLATLVDQQRSGGVLR